MTNCLCCWKLADDWYEYMPKWYHSFWHAFSNGINIFMWHTRRRKLYSTVFQSLHIKHLSVNCVRTFQPKFCFDFMINDELSTFTLNSPFIEQQHHYTIHNRTYGCRPNESILIYHFQLCASWIGNFGVLRSMYRITTLKWNAIVYKWIWLHCIWRNSRWLVWCGETARQLIRSSVLFCDDILLTTFDIDTGYGHHHRTLREQYTQILLWCNWISIRIQSNLLHSH